MITYFDSRGSTGIAVAIVCIGYGLALIWAARKSERRLWWRVPAAAGGMLTMIPFGLAVLQRGFYAVNWAWFVLSALLLIRLMLPAAPAVVPAARPARHAAG
jgi:hypothetical protein